MDGAKCLDFHRLSCSFNWNQSGWEPMAFAMPVIDLGLKQANRGSDGGAQEAWGRVGVVAHGWHG